MQIGDYEVTDINIGSIDAIAAYYAGEVVWSKDGIGAFIMRDSMGEGDWVFLAESNMTWAQWLISQYNTKGDEISFGSIAGGGESLYGIIIDYSSSSSARMVVLGDTSAAQNQTINLGTEYLIEFKDLSEK